MAPMLQRRACRSASLARHLASELVPCGGTEEVACPREGACMRGMGWIRLMALNKRETATRRDLKGFSATRPLFAAVDSFSCWAREIEAVLGLRV